MSQPCTYKFGEFSPEEWSGEEWFIGYEDCSVSSTDINCNNLFLHPKPYQSSQWEIDYNLLWSYVQADLLANSLVIMNKVEIGLTPELELDFSKQTKYLVDFMLLFKEQLKANPTVSNYVTLFTLYKLSCVNTHFSSIFKKPKYVKQMLKLLNISTLIELPDNVYQLEDELDLDPIYYIAEL